MIVHLVDYNADNNCGDETTITFKKYFNNSPEKVCFSVAKSFFSWGLFGSSSSPFSYAFSASSGFERNEYAAPNRE